MVLLMACICADIHEFIHVPLFVTQKHDLQMLHNVHSHAQYLA